MVKITYGKNYEWSNYEWSTKVNAFTDSSFLADSK